MKDVKLILDDQELDYDVSASEFPISFDYALEDVYDFQVKKSSESFEVKVPGTLKNQTIFNTMNNLNVTDMTSSQYYRNMRKIVVETNGMEVFKGSAVINKVELQYGKPKTFELNFYGNNSEWILPLKEVTLYDLYKHVKFIFNRTTITSSWMFDGRDESIPVVFAPVKYAGWLDPDIQSDSNYSVKTMKPSLSIYWIIYWAFKSIGYKIESDFFDSDYGRRLVMPWTFGPFLTSEGTKYQIHKFLAKSTKQMEFSGDMNRLVNLEVYDNVDTGTFDNNNTVPGGDYDYYEYTPGNDFSMRWMYKTPHYGALEVSFQLSLYYDYRLDNSSDFRLTAEFYKNGNLVKSINVRDDKAPTIGNATGSDLAIHWFETTVNPGDLIECKIRLRIRKTGSAKTARCYLKVDEYKIAYFKIPTGGEIQFDSYLTLQKEKFIDLMRGLVDLFDLAIQTDPVKKIVCIEPSHSYSLNNNFNTTQGGYFNKNSIDWTGREDISEVSSISLYNDNARQFTFQFSDDTDDGALKVIQDRYKITIGAGKYVFNERFKAEKKVYENRYFSPTMHYLVDDFKYITGISPQMICLVPENISNTSSSESENTFSPKIAYYKGILSGIGGWVFDDDTLYRYPYMFAVNYKPGGENDPILSYSDERIGDATNSKIGRGLLKRFFWPRLAIMDYGQWYMTNVRLNNKDITNWLHRERIHIDGNYYELINIKGYKPNSDQSCECTLRQYVPLHPKMRDKTYPSESSIIKNAVVVYGDKEETNSTELDKVFDTQYNQMLCLYTDIPRKSNETE